jgi:hypothetical protein
MSKLKSIWKKFQDREKWEWIVGYEGFYKVSTLGRIKGVPRVSSGRKVPMKILATNETRGKCMVHLCKDGVAKWVLVRHCVAYAFLGPFTENEILVNKNGNTKDNRLSNLEYRLPNPRNFSGSIPDLDWEDLETQKLFD